MKKTIVALIVCLSLGFSFSAFAEGKQLITSKEYIAYPKTYDLISSGASSYQGIGNVPNSPYFSQQDYYNLKDRKGLVLLPHYATYQQTQETTSAPASALTLLYYYGNTSYHELKVAEEMGTFLAFSESGEIGTSVEKVAKFFEKIGYKTESSLNVKTKNGLTCATPTLFKEFITKSLKEKTPILVENMYMGGRWRVIIGYDTMDTPATTDDVIIFMNPYDVFDQKQDGYSVESAEYFYFTWMDIGIMPRGQQMQPWVKVKPVKTE
ncbi:MAG: hypothetical protein RR272_04610 [Synergistaceae bacterium]